jgi:hypothetical protein
MKNMHGIELDGLYENQKPNVNVLPTDVPVPVRIFQEKTAKETAETYHRVANQIIEEEPHESAMASKG